MPAVKKTIRSTSKVGATKVPVKTLRQAQGTKGEVKKVEVTLSVALFDQLGKETGTVALPEAVFGGKINKALMAQAVRVYLANQRMGSAKTKTRGQVDGSTRKIYRQKGTGRARHGGIRAPIFVGGGIAHGPKVKDYSLDLPSKMKKAAVVSALSAMAKEGKVKVVAGFTSLDGKTQQVAKAFAGMGLTDKKALLVMPEHVEKVFKAARNIDRMAIDQVKGLNTYEVLNAGTVIVMQEALDILEKTFKSVRPVREVQSVKENK